MENIFNFFTETEKSQIARIHGDSQFMNAKGVQFTERETPARINLFFNNPRSRGNIWG